jgi:membrane protein implicated in regulation of membrane protease activity
MEAIHWLILFVVLLLIEAVTLNLTTIWFAGGALIAFMSALLNADVMWQIVLFLVVSLALLIFTRPLAVKFINKGRTKTNVDSLIGVDGIVQEKIDNLQATGKIMLRGVEWTARASEENTIIDVNRVVTVLGISGVKVIVKEKEEE